MLLLHSLGTRNGCRCKPRRHRSTSNSRHVRIVTVHEGAVAVTRSLLIVSLFWAAQFQMAVFASRLPALPIHGRIANLWPHSRNAPGDILEHSLYARRLGERAGVAKGGGGLEGFIHPSSTVSRQTTLQPRQGSVQIRRAMLCDGPGAQRSRRMGAFA